MTLDGICRSEGIRRIDFLKMNIEGAEKDALAGMHQTPGMTRRLCIACHDFRAERGHGAHYRSRKRVRESCAKPVSPCRCEAGDERDYVRDHVYATRDGADKVTPLC